MDEVALQSRLRAGGQEHLCSYLEALDEEGRQRLIAQLEQVDLPQLQALYRGKEAAIDWVELAARAEPPRGVLLGETPDGYTAVQVRQCGEAALRAGEVAMMLVAGGQATRLGFDRPKGLYPLGPLSQRSLFQILIDRLRAVARRYDATIPLFLMTSPATHQETVNYFVAHDWLGLDPDSVQIFCQGQMPAVAAEDGRLLMAAPDRLALSPDGHGGMLAAWRNSGGLERAASRGVRVLFYGQVDNPLLQVCDPFFLGCHLLTSSEMTTQVVRKQDPLERVGTVVDVDGRTQIIEYSDLPLEAAMQRTGDGQLRHWAGNLAVHAFDLAFLQRAAGAADSLPFHRAHKAVPYVTPDGELHEPQQPNALKFERFIFDLLPAARRTLVVEVAKQDAFAPVKNAEGASSDTPLAAQHAMMERDRRLLRQAGAIVEDNVWVEVNPLWALDADDAAARLPKSFHVTHRTYFSENGPTASL